LPGDADQQETKMTIVNSRTAAAWVALAALVLSGIVSTAARAQAPAVDPAAVQILKKTTEYLGGLEKFSVDTLNIVEDVLESGHKVQFDVGAGVVLQRPNKLHGQRKNDLVNQSLYYDGKTVVIYDASAGFYASAAVPGTIEQMLQFTGETLGLLLPASDLLYRNAFPLLMQDVTFAVVVGKAMIGGVKCDHLLFSRPGVDIQIWVPDAGKPLPLKYVVTDTSVPEQPETIAVMSNWNTAPSVTDATFAFAPPQGAKKTEFMPLSSWAAP
jgi:hypothetical protein